MTVAILKNVAQVFCQMSLLLVWCDMVFIVSLGRWVWGRIPQLGPCLTALWERVVPTGPVQLALTAWLGSCPKGLSTISVVSTFPFLYSILWKWVTEASSRGL